MTCSQDGEPYLTTTTNAPTTLRRDSLAGFADSRGWNIMPFLTDFNDNPTDNGLGGVLEEELVYYSVRYDETFTIPVGQESDYGSVPAPFNILLPRGAQFRANYFLHDYFYRNGIVSRYKADIILKDSIEETAKTREHFTNYLWKARSWMAFFGVRIGGFKAYKPSFPF